MFSVNSASEGGGIYNTASLSISNCTFSANSATYGGGIFNSGMLSASTTTFTGNSASNGGGLLSANASTVNACAFIQNSAVSAGGGIAAGGDMTISNSTFSGNLANAVGGGVYCETGAFVTVGNTTIYANSGSNGGGGIFVEPTGADTTLLNSLVADNRTNTESNGPDINGILQNTSTFNLVGDGTAMSYVINGYNGNIVGTSASPIAPGLLPLDYNGGPTETMALLANSPARHAGGRLTSLSAAVTSTASSIPVGFRAAIASTPGSYVIQVEGEQMLVTNVSGNNLTVTRGYNGTTAVAHGLGAKVYLATDQTGAPRAGAADIGAYQYQTVNSAVNPLPATESSISFPVSWTGAPGTEDYPISYYSIYVSNDDAPFTLWKHNTTSTSGTFTGVNGDTYRFYSIATDSNGDVQITPPPQATTTITVPAPAAITSASAAYMIVGASSPFTVTATGYPMPTFSETGTLPGGLTFNTTTGVLGGTPATGTVGSYSLTIGASNDVGAPASQPFTLTIAKSPAKTTLTKNTTGATKYGQSVTFTAAVAPTATNSITPTGTVSFQDGATVLGTATLSGGKATFTTSSLAVASHSITAVYAGDGNFTTSTSSASTQTVSKASTTTTLTKNTTGATKFGQSVTFTAKLAAVSPGAGTPTGTVTFKNGSTTLGTATLSSGVATLTTTALPVASNSVTAVYGGDANFNTSTSGALSQTVSQSATTTRLTKNTTSAIHSGQSVTFTATLAAVSPGSGTPSGIVTFYDNGSTVLGTGALTGGIATFTTTTLPLGSNSITASYGGDADFSASTSAALSQTVTS